MDPKSRNNRFEETREKLLSVSDWLHQRNKSRIRYGSILLLLLPVLLFIVRWLTGSDKVVFLMFWVASMFLLSAYLIGVEYLDDTMQRTLTDLTDQQSEFDRLIKPKKRLTSSFIKEDFKRLTSSVVAIVIMIGLCVLPCLYAWFNIMSNWDPYEKKATGRIAVAVANEDKGMEMMGLYINVGEKITESLEANSDIGWVFVGSGKKALEGLDAGDYYAAVVIPEDFSRDILSFTTGDLKHPELDYYENVKKNAIAPKITEKARAALKSQVDAAFIQTVGKYVAEAKAVADATGMEPEDMFDDLGNQLDLLGERMNDLVAMVTAAQDLSDAADELLRASGGLTASSQDAMKEGDKVLKEEEKALPRTEADAKAVSASIRKEAAAIQKSLNKLYTALSAISTDMDAYNDFVINDLEADKKLVNDMADSAQKAVHRLSRLGLAGMAARFQQIANDLREIYSKLDSLETADETTWPQIQKTIDSILTDVKDSADTAGSIAEDASRKIDDKITKAIKNTRKSIEQIRSSLLASYDNLDTLSTALDGTEDALKVLDGGLNVSVSALLDMQTGFQSLAEMFDSLADSDLLKDVNYLTSDGSEVIASNLAAPIHMETVTVYPIRNYGSAMASFYTVLAQWVGALFAAILIRVRIRRKGGSDEEPEPSLIRQYFLRFRLFFLVGITQALIVSLGDLLYIGIQCHHPVLFVIAACVNGTAFMMINYALVFAFDKVGMGAAVIVLLLQVAGSGGTFPPDVLPKVFQVLYPFMPFRYAMDAMRECIYGMYGTRYLTCIFILLLFTAAAAAAGLLLSRPASILNRAISNSMAKSDLMISDD